jgi:hypothetical protein
MAGIGEFLRRHNLVLGRFSVRSCLMFDHERNGKRSRKKVHYIRILEF